MQSAIYQGKVFHARHYPKKHAFSYNIFLLWLHLDEVVTLEQQVRFFSASAWAPLHFRRSDYLGDATMPLKQAVLAKMSQLAGEPLTGEVYFLGQVRTFGLYFSPVNFYYLRQPDGQYSHTLAEVSNTPWQDRHCYLVDLAHQQDSEKKLHVSPFNPMDMQYKWNIAQPSERLTLSLKCVKQITHLDTSLNLKRSQMNSKSVCNVLLKIPSMTVKTIFGIYWQATKLFIKRVPFYAHPTQGKK